MEAKLRKLYENPEIGLGSKNNFYLKAKEIIPNLTLKDVDEFLKSLAVNQITKPINVKDRKFSTIKSFGVRNNYQIDIMNLPHPTKNKNYKYLLSCIDVYSRYAIGKPLKTKSGDVVLKAFKEIIEEIGLCKNLNCDEGSEFTYKPFQKYCDDNNIDVWMSDPEQENKNSIIERWHRTIRSIILKYCLLKGSSYIDVLPLIIKNYNTNLNRTINVKPIDVWEGKVKPEQEIQKVEMKYKVGDRVRHIVKKSTFDKSSSTGNYTVSVYTISKIDGNSIYLNDLKKPFRDFELILAVEDANNNKVAEKHNKNVEQEKKKELIKRRLNREGLN